MSVEGDERSIVPGAESRVMDLIRLVAAILVLLSHGRVLFGWSSPWWGFLGPPAVAAFFIVSGFCIWGGVSSKPRFRAGDFLVDRVRRIYPPFIASMFLMWGCACVLERRILPFPVVEAIGNLLMLQDVGAVRLGAYWEPFMGNVVLWSLAYEWWIYLIVIPLKQWSTDRTRLFLVPLVAIGCGWVYHKTAVPLLSYGTYLGLWWMGAELWNGFHGAGRSAAAVLVRILWLGGVTAAFWVLDAPVEMIGYLPTALYFHPYLLLLQTLVGALLCVLLVGWKWSGWMGVFLIPRALLLGAKISYGIYLFQIPVGLLLGEWTKGASDGVRVSVAFLGTSLIAYVADYRLDRWAKAWMVHLRGRLARTGGAAGGEDPRGQCGGMAG